MKLLCLALVLVACGQLERHKPKAAERDARTDQLLQAYSAKRLEYAELAAVQHGWPSTEDCDATLWAGLACAGGAEVAIEEAELEPGMIHRRPKVACWSPELGDQGSKMTTSRDMQTGYLWCAWRRGDRAMLERLAKYGEDHDFVMGQPVAYAAEMHLGTNLIGVLGRSLYALSQGQDDRYYRRLFRFYAPVEQDYEKHIQTLSIALQGEVSEDLRLRGLDTSLDAQASLLDINGAMLERLEALERELPQDFGVAAALAVYTGDYAKTMDLLLDPATPVPTYVRGQNPEMYARARWLFWARFALRRMGEAT